MAGAPTRYCWRVKADEAAFTVLAHFEVGESTQRPVRSARERAASVRELAPVASPANALPLPPPKRRLGSSRVGSNHKRRSRPAAGRLLDVFEAATMSFSRRRPP